MILSVVHVLRSKSNKSSEKDYGKIYWSTIIRAAVTSHLYLYVRLPRSEFDSQPCKDPKRKGFFFFLLYIHSVFDPTVPLNVFNIDQPRKSQDKNKKKTDLVWSPFYIFIPKITLYELGDALALHPILLQPKKGHRTNLISKSEVMMAAKGSSALEVYSP